jgi:hypothetical protein
MASDGNFDIVPLDSLPQARHVGALHLDIEGMKIDAIQDALFTLMNNTPPLILEIVHVDKRNLEKILKPLGYKRSWNKTIEGNMLYTA